MKMPAEFGASSTAAAALALLPNEANAASIANQQIAALLMNGIMLPGTFPSNSVVHPAVHHPGAAASIASSSAASAHHSLAHPVASMSMANPASANGMPPHLAAAIATVASQHQTATAAAAAGPPAMD
jgi:hypothetical protein